MISIDMSGVNSLIAAFSAASAAAKVGADKAVDETAEATAEVIRSNVPVLTGELQSDVRVEDAGDEALVISTVRQGFFQEFGTQYHAPQPSFFPAADGAENALANAMLDVGVPW